MKLRAVVAKNLRILRRQRGLTQEILADSASINRNYVGQIEREEKSPTIDVIEKLAKSLEVSPDSLLQTPRHK
jgi:transcriptional regulator with XRE-family HTH domain